MLCTYYKKQVF